ncbi:hypothetical protein [Arenicella xantha]|uniref:EF hand domain-containing protein n=1 Tax=Arenicella xantha TaxID=644221 RepID=A0A395JRT0_9GAMM|nr:hypothetical protein [Arenicella xantha]RBP53285.1 EF hand domain-containing protein [Arenicella xantha]
MHNKSLISLLAAFSLTATGIAIAQSEDSPSDRRGHHKESHDRGGKDKKHEYMLKRIDTNQDGQVDRAEYMASAEERFASMDLNSDGYVTPEEHREAGKIMREKHREMRKQMREERRAEREAKADQ